MWSIKCKVYGIHCRFMPRSHIHGSSRRYYYGLNLTDDPRNANFRSPIRMHYKLLRMMTDAIGKATDRYWFPRMMPDYIRGLYGVQSLNVWPGHDSQTCLKRPLKKKTKIGFQDQSLLNAGQRYCRMLQREHSAILSTFIKLPSVIKIFVLSFLSGLWRQVLLYSLH